MPPRTGPRRRKRIKQAVLPVRHFAVIRGEAATGTIVSELVTAHSLELDDHDLVFRDGSGAVSQVFARDRWLQVRPAAIGDIPYADEAGDNAIIDSMSREEATLTPPADPAVTSGTAVPRTVEFDTVLKPIREEDRRFPSSPEEAQRVLRELHRRISPDYQDPPDNPAVDSGTAPPAPPRKE